MENQERNDLGLQLKTDLFYDEFSFDGDYQYNIYKNNQSNNNNNKKNNIKNNKNIYL